MIPVLMILAMLVSLAVCVWAGCTGYRITLTTPPTQYDEKGNVKS